MPGVPSGRACDACRVARKKCDCTEPICSRCRRLNISCVGSGQRRFQFKGPKCDRKTHSPPKQFFEIWQPPSSPSELLAASLLKIISTQTEYRFNLLQSYGAFLNYLPQRLGTSNALDSACQALVLSHHDICCKRQVSPNTTVAYGTALEKLRIALDDPVEATSVESLGASVLLVICRDLNGFGIQDWEIHSLGATEIVQARGHVRSQDDFELHLMGILQGYMVGHCMLFRSMRLDPDRFERLVETFADDLQPDNVLRYIYNVPRLLQRGRMLRYDLKGMQCLLLEINNAYETVTDLRHELRHLLDTALLRESKPRFQALSGYAFTLAVCQLYHCILSGPQCGTSSLKVTGETLAKATLCLAEEVKSLSPLGSAYMFLTLPLAWLCAEEMETKRGIQDAVLHLQQSYHRGKLPASFYSRFEELRYDLHFGIEVNHSEHFIKQEL